MNMFLDQISWGLLDIPSFLRHDLLALQSYSPLVRKILLSLEGTELLLRVKKKRQQKLSIIALARIKIFRLHTP